MEKLTLALQRTKDKKDKVVSGSRVGSVIQSVYIHKDALGGVPLAKIEVVIPLQQNRARLCATRPR